MPLPRQERLRRPEQFARVRREGKTWAHPLFILNAARNRTGRTRTGFVVGKQIGKAHDRNRAKRRAGEAFRIGRAQVKPGWDLIFIIRAPLLAAPFPDISRAMGDLLRRAQLWVPPPKQEHGDGTPDCTDDHSPVSTLLAPDTT